MKPTIRTRKPVDKLKFSDFRAFPIWEFAIDEEDKPGRDETWVRPVKAGVVPKGAYSQLVATTFTTPSGSKLNGFMTVTTEKTVEIGNGILLGKVGYKSLPMMSRKQAETQKDRWAIEDRDGLVQVIGGPESEVFPLTYSLVVLIQGEKTLRQGTVE